MQQAQILKQKVLNLKAQDFDDLALEIFRFQAEYNLVYKKYLQHLHIQTNNIKTIEQIPFLPIEFFKTQTVVTGENPIKTVFESSGTTGQNTSRHHVADPDFYLEIAEQIFEKFYGKLTDFQILALLPSYLERNNSSLVYMVEHFIKKTNNPNSGFFLNDYEKLAKILKEGGSEKRRQKTGDRSKETNNQSTNKPVTILIGVTFGLLDFAESNNDLSFLKDRNDLIVMETGGMKGRRKELLREEVHEILTKAFHVDSIHSEYGMTELLSQGYSSGEGIFDLPVSMKILFRDVNDPFTYLHNARTGGVNVIDLANIDSCCFIETKDLGAVFRDSMLDVRGSEQTSKFKILGRFDNSDIRGCNLMIS
jgi:Acyl-protein synthetase, LuxE